MGGALRPTHLSLEYTEFFLLEPAAYLHSPMISGVIFGECAYFFIRDKSFSEDTQYVCEHSISLVNTQFSSVNTKFR